MWYIYDQAYSNSPTLAASMHPPKMMCDVYVVTGEVRSILYELHTRLDQIQDHRKDA